MLQVLNKRDKEKLNEHPGSVYVGRPSIWGNPFQIGRDGTRVEVIKKYRIWLQEQPKLLEKLSSLRGKHLVCWCAPLPCHADVLLELANTKETRQ